MHINNGKKALVPNFMAQKLHILFLLMLQIVNLQKIFLQGDDLPTLFTFTIDLEKYAITSDDMLILDIHWEEGGGHEKVTNYS